MENTKIAHALQNYPIRVKGSPRLVARVIGWVHAHNGTIAIRDDQFRSPFVEVQYGHYRDFIRGDHARMMELISPVYEELNSTAQTLRILGVPQTISHADISIQALRDSRNARKNQSQINALKIQKKKLEAQIQDYEKIYQDRCGKAQGIIEARLSSYRCGAAGKLFKCGLDINAPTAGHFPDLPERLIAANEQED